jgi:UDP-GlcNAc:undecaprenyl-phosphate GlcNAc-1-phosphate transferase
MKSYVAAFVVALVTGLLFTPLVLRLAVRWGAVSGRGGRHVHSRAVPRLGGLAVASGWCLSLVGFRWFDGYGYITVRQHGGWLLGVVGGALAMCLVGAVDDIRGVRAMHKLIAQVAVAMFAYGCGFRIDAVSLPFIGTLSMGAFAVPVTVAWIVGITNALNLIDGLDGLAAGVSFFAALTGFAVAILNGSSLAALVFAPLMGVLLGFLVFNFNPARIFLGDSGSYFLGYVLATTSLAGSIQQKASTAVSLLVPMIALGLPIFDTLFAMLRRALERRPIFAADRGHVHHRLLEIGLTHRRAVILLYGVSVTFAACAITVSLGRSWITGGALLAASVVLIGLVRFAGYFEYLHRHTRQVERLYDPAASRLREAVPELLSHLSGCRSERDVVSYLPAIADACGCGALELRAEHGAVSSVGDSTRLGVTAASASFPVGPDAHALCHLQLVWEGEHELPSPQAAILLQLVVDAMARALLAAGSNLAPRFAPNPASVPPPHANAIAAAGSGRT